MATFFNNNLYPPIMPDVLPAFTSDICQIPFGFSIYNSPSDVAAIQMSVINQRTNASALDTDLYPLGIKFIFGGGDALSDTSSEYNYAVFLESNDLKTKSFETNEFYKIQLRFISTGASISTNSSAEISAKWMTENQAFFSEWSTVCLIRKITEPQLILNGFEKNDDEDTQTVFNSSLIEVVGGVNFAQDQNEYLKNYRIRVYETDSNELIEDSGDIYTDEYGVNELNYTIQQEFEDGVTYTLEVTYETNNSYTQSVKHKFLIIQGGMGDLDVTIRAIPENKNGRMRVYITSNSNEPFLGNFTIRRTSSESGFHKWEDIKTVVYESNEKINYSFYDVTVQSGIWYKYCVQKRDANGGRGTIVRTEKPSMCVFEDIFLTKGNRQLKVQLNSSVTDFKYNVMESQQQTIGSKYPFIKRNGKNYFRTFNLSGLISFFVDENDWYDPHFVSIQEYSKNGSLFSYQTEENTEFDLAKADGSNWYFDTDIGQLKQFTSREEALYNNSDEIKALYEEYNQNNKINYYQDYIYERAFRQKVYDFLYKNDVKLFRSTTEGNILVKLMNIGFQPMESLGRMVYSFSATAVQIDEPTIVNFDKYEIQTIGTYNPQIGYEYQVLGQIQTEKIDRKTNIITKYLNEKYRNYTGEGYINTVKYLKYLKIEITSPPSLLNENFSGYEIEIGTNSGAGHTTMILPSKMIRRNSKKQSAPNTNKFSIDYVGFFELKEPNTAITYLAFSSSYAVTIDYIAVLEEKEDNSELVNKVSYFNKVGQLYGTFSPEESLVRKIYNKYFEKYSTYFQRLLAINGIKIEGPQGLIAYIQDSKDTGYDRHILGTGYLELKDENALIEGIYLGGVHLEEISVNEEQIAAYKNHQFRVRDNQCIYIPGEYDIDISKENYELPQEIKNPVENGIYQIKYYGILYPFEYSPSEKGALRQEADLVVAPDDDSVQATKRSYLIDDNRTEDDDITLILKNLFDKSEYSIFYHGNWYPFNNETNDVICPVDAIIDYECEVIRGDYHYVQT